MRLRAVLLVSILMGLNAFAQEASEAKKLKAIVDEYTRAAENLDAFYADEYGIEENLDKFGDYPSDAFYTRLQAMIKTALEKIKTIDTAKLTEGEKIECRLFRNDMETSYRQFQFPVKYLDFHQMVNRLNSYIDQANPSISSYPFDSLKHYESFIKRSEGFAAYIDNQIAVLKEGIAKKVTQNCLIVDKTANAYKDGMIETPEKNPFYAPVKTFPQTISKKEQVRLRAEFKNMITTRIIPGFKKFDQFFKTEYKAHCRKEFGIGSLPDSKGFYSYAILSQTDTDLGAAEIHQMGEKEVARIEAELDDVRKQMGFKGTRQEFLRSLRKEPKYFFTNEKQLVGSFNQVRREVKKLLPQYFSLLPKTDVKIVRSTNPEDASGIYHSPTDMNPVGRFVYNATQIRQIPRYNVATLLMHETVPGHHLQLGLAFDMKNELSEYRRKLFYSTAFVEGWALYSEYLGREMGIYKDPLRRLGNLNDELLRAVRLVVDTGIHSMGWDHDQTVAYMKAHLASDGSEIEIEANRYSVLIGQALAYKIGQLKILELRKKAEAQLAQNFDIRGFHRAVIGAGSVSLPVLEEQVNDYISTLKSRTRAPTSN